MTHDQLKYALALQTFKNFSRAAESCRISQPSLSVQIAKLEEELGVKLFDRAKSSVKVTVEGEDILKQIRVVIDETSRINDVASRVKGEVQGAFHLGIIPTLAPALLPLFLSSFRKQNPQVRLSVDEEPTESLIRRIGEGSLDAAVLSTPARCPESLVEKVLFYEPFVVFASTDHPMLSNKRVTPKQILADEILLLDDAHCFRDQVLQLCRAGHEKQGHPLRIKSGSLHTLIEIIRLEKNYTLLPLLSTSSLSKAEQKQNLRSFVQPGPTRKVSLVYHQSRLKQSIIDAIASSIVDSIPRQVFLTDDLVRVISPDSRHFVPASR
ncbi:MAG: LysR family transcriptional regulator [Methylotenera sp.]|nr:LysR family transcriptional regulator [Oligoflexia bacterium]